MISPSETTRIESDISEISESEISEISESAISEISESAISEISEREISEISESAIFEISESAISEISESAISLGDDPLGPPASGPILSYEREFSPMRERIGDGSRRSETHVGTPAP